MDSDISELRRCLEARDLLGVAEALQRNPEAMRVVDHGGRNPLVYAAQEFPEAVPFLIACIDSALDGATTSALDRVAELTRALLCAVDVKHQTAEQAPASLIAVEALLRAGADPNRENALHAVADASPLAPVTVGPLVALLLEYGVDVQRWDELGRVPLDIAYMCCNTPATRLLRSVGARLVQQVSDPSAAMGAELGLIALSGSTDELERHLASTGVAIDSRDQYGRTALHAAAACGDAAMVECLLHRGADVMARCHYRGWNGGITHDVGETPLHAAAGSGYPGTIRLLLDAGADPSARAIVRGGRETPLMAATLGAAFNQRSKPDAYASLHLLIERGADVRARNDMPYAIPFKDSLNLDKEGDAEPEASETDSPAPATALMFAAWVGYPEEVKILIEGGAVTSREDLLEAIHTTIPHGYQNLPALWEAGRQRLNPPLTLAEIVPYLDGVGLRFLLEALGPSCIDINEPDSVTGETTLDRLLARVGQRSDPWREDQFVYDKETVSFLRRYATE